MSISAPRSPRPDRSQDAATLIVLLGLEDGSAPTIDDEVDYLIPQRIGIYANGGRDDVMTFSYDMERAEARLVDTTTPIGFHRQIEVRMLDEDDEPTKILAWGFIARQPQVINDTSEKVDLEVRLDQHVFGEPLTDYPTWDAVAATHLNVQLPLVFNPEIDEIVEGNCSDMQKEPPEGVEPDDFDGDFHYLIDPESVRTEAARTMQEQEASLWTLPQAVHMLCWHMNPDEEYIKNPSLADLETELAGRTALIKNVEIPLGAFLPAALDVLLLPAEYGWHLTHELVEDEESEDDDAEKLRETRMRFYKRGSGAHKRLHMQRPGETKDLKKTNVDEFAATYSIVDLANRAEVYGAFQKREDTFILQKGWDEADDELDLADLEKDQPTAIEKPFVGRKWVLNEAGDYIGRRAEIIVAFDVSNLFSFDEECSFRRRKFHQCLSQTCAYDAETENPAAFAERESNGFRVDWFNHDAGIAATAWVSATRYYIGQVISHSGSIYVATADTLGLFPPPTSAWEYVGLVAPPTWSSVATYALDDEVTYLTIRYRSLQGSNFNENPSSRPTWWTNIEADLVGGEWQKVKWPFSILAKECGIMFEGPTPPEALWQYMLEEPDLARVRITATILGDRRITGIAERRDQSPNGLNLTLVLDLGENFQDSAVHSQSLFEASESIARDDQEAIDEYAETVRDIEDAAQISCSVRLEGIEHAEYEFGDLIEKVEGRNLSLDGYTPATGAVTPRRPQVVGFNYLVAGGQHLELLLESFKQERPEV